MSVVYFGKTLSNSNNTNNNNKMDDSIQKEKQHIVIDAESMVSDSSLYKQFKEKDDSLLRQIENLSGQLRRARSLDTTEPAIIGFGGLGFAIFTSQFHRFGHTSVGLNACVTFLFGGILQFLAGVQLHKRNNAFSYGLFCMFGVYSMLLGVITFCHLGNFFEVKPLDMLPLNIMFALYNGFWLAPTMTMSIASFALTCSFFGAFVFLCLGEAVPPHVEYCTSLASSVCFIAGGILSWYFMLNLVYVEIYHRDVFPLGPPPVKLFQNWISYFKQHKKRSTI